MSYVSNNSNKNVYDIIIIGAGFGGYSAGIYSARYNLKTLIIAKEFGGAIMDAGIVENYPGFIKINAVELMQKLEEQAKAQGAEVLHGETLEIIKKNDLFIVKAKDKEYQSKAVIVASGTERRKLQVPGAEEYKGKGVHYCATCDGVFYRDKITAVIGGSNSAAHAAMLLEKYAKKVYIIYRRDKMRCEPILLSRLEQMDKIEIIYNTNVVEVKGSRFVEKVILDKEYKESKELKLDGVFVEIGSDPATKIVKNLGVELSEAKEIIVDKNCSTNIKGVFAAGDVTNTVLRQGVVAAGQGTIAATSVYKYLSGKNVEKGW